MLLQEEFARLVHFYQLAAEGAQVDVNDVFRKSLDFIKRLTWVIQQGSPQEKEVALRIMREFEGHAQSYMKKVSEKAGVPEEVLLENSGKQESYSEEGWREMQADKAQIAEAGQALLAAFQGSGLSGEKPLPSGPASIKPPESTKKPPGSGKGKGVKKTGWMRS